VTGPLVHPRSFCVVPANAARRDLRRAGVKSRGCRRVRSRDRADVTLVVGEGIVLRDGTVLGPGAGLWTSTLQAGITAPGIEPCARGCLLLTQGCAVAEEILAAAAARGLPIKAAISVGEREGALERIVLQALRRHGDPRVLAALHRPPAPGLLHGIPLLDPPPAVLLLSGAARQPLALPFGATVSPRALARAVGIPVVTTPGELVNLAWLLEHGPVPRGPATVQVRGTSPDETALLGDAVQAAGLATTASPRESCCTLSGPRSPARAGGLSLVSARERLQPWQATRDTLAALAELGALPRPSAARAPRRSRPARRLLDGCPRALDEAQLRRLLACYRIDGPPGRLVTAASAAGDAARAVGLPVRARAVGPGLGGPERGAESIAGARLAFQRVIQDCARMLPLPEVEGVLVHRDIPASGLVARVLWPRGGPPLVALRAAQEEVVLVCPAGRAALEQAAAVLARPLRLGPIEAAALGRFVRRLCALGADLADRMSWLHLARISAPAARTPPLVIQASGAQTEGLRRPSWL